MNGEKSLRKLTNDVDVNEITIRRGIIKYNNLEVLRNYNPKLKIYMKDCNKKSTIYIIKFLVKKEPVFKLILSYF